MEYAYTVIHRVREAGGLRITIYSYESLEALRAERYASKTSTFYPDATEELKSLYVVPR